MVSGIGLILLGGHGHLGSRIAGDLSGRGYQVVVIERSADPQAEGVPTADGYFILAGDICDEAVLLRAGIERAACFLAVTGDDSVNLEAAITARQLVPEIHAVVRMFDQTLFPAIETAFGIQALSASFLALPAYISAATENAILAAFEIDNRQLTFYQAEQPPSRQGVFLHKCHTHLSVTRERSCEDGQRLYATLDDFGFSVVHKTARRTKHGPGRYIRQALRACHPHALVRSLEHIWRTASIVTRRLLVALLIMVCLSVTIYATVGGMTVLNALYFVVTTLTTVGYGDFNLQSSPPLLKLFGIVMMLCGATLLATIYTIISDAVLTARIEFLLGRRGVTLQEHIVVVGLGKIGYRVARTLHTLGLPVVAIEADDDHENVGAARAMLPVIIGNAARNSVLQKAGVDQASTLLALTDNPMLNLSIVLQARQMNPSIRTIIRTYENRFADKLQRFTLDAVLSSSAIAAPVFANAAVYPGVEGSFTFDGDDLLVVRHIITDASPLKDLTVGEVGAQCGIAVVLVQAADDVVLHLASPDFTLRVGTQSILLLSRTNIALLACGSPARS